MNRNDWINVSILFIPILSLWSSFAWVQRFHWGSESYYNFGGYVIPAFILLLIFRLKDFPAGSPQTGVAKWLGLGGCLAICSALFPLRLLNEVNIFWRVPFILQGVLLVICSVLFTWVWGGRKVAMHLMFPLLFLFTMIPWPFRIEVIVIQQLTQFVTHAAVLLIQLLGYPSSIQGNTIVIGSNWLGVDEACSGIRSLQALLMIALWLGEFMRLTIVRRIGLFLFAVFLTIAFNVIRATGLSLVTFHGGLESYDKWHDPMGLITFFVSVFVLYFSAEKLESTNSEKMREVNSLNSFALSSLVSAKFFSLVIVLYSVFLPIGVEAWFRSGDEEELKINWKLDITKLPRTEVEALEISDRIEDILGFDFGDRWLVPLGLEKELEVYFYGYNGNDRMSSVSSYGHSPFICIQGIGGDVNRVLEPLKIEHSNKLSFELNHVQFAVRFETGEVTQSDLFWCVWERNPLGISYEQLGSLDYSLQWKMVKNRRRDFSRNVLLIAVNNAVSASQARTMVKEFLDTTIVVSETE